MAAIERILIDIGHHVATMDIPPIAWSLLPVVEVVWLVLSAIYLILQRRSSQATLAWFFALAFLPVVGILVYLVFGPRRFEKRKKRRARAQEAVRELAIDERMSELDIPAPVKRLIELAEGAAGRAARPRLGQVQVFFNGKDKYDALAASLSQAKHHIHIEYYIWEPDETGTRLRDVLAERAKAGVEVRVLVDGFGSSKAHDRFWSPLTDAGGRVVRFNELTLTRFRPSMTNFRTHRKIAVIDGRVAFTGGMNITDVHTSAVSGTGAWRDTHMRVEGDAALGLQLVFFEDWYYATDQVPEGEAYLARAERAAEENASAGGEGRDEPVQIIASGPDENLDAIHKVYFSSIAAADRQVLLTTPYFVPDEALVTALTSAALRGADVRILVPATGDVPLVSWASRSYYLELLEVGVRIFEYGPPELHAKTLAVDDTLAIIGTANADNRSFRLNFEVVAALYDRKRVAELRDAFEADLAEATEVTLDAVRNTPLGTRLRSSAARLFSPIL